MEKTQALPPCILAVDDSAVNLKLLTELLERQGYRVVPTTNSLEVLPLVEDHNPDLILMDLMMPGLSGFDLISRLQAQAETSETPIIVISARNDSEAVAKALEQGAYDFIKKPLDEVEVLARVRSTLKFKAQKDRLRELSIRDSLTGLYNHALIMDLLEKELYNHRRRGQSLALLMIDVDFFKRVNDDYGHLAGDAVLREVGHFLGSTLRKGDVVGRYGGEEFAVVLPGVSLEDGAALGNRLREQMSVHDISADGQNLRITVSLGLALWTPESGLSGRDLVRQADEALYRAKEEGRNRLVVAG